MMNQGGLLALADRLPIGELPVEYQAPMRRYVVLGVEPTGALLAMLEGGLSAALARMPPESMLGACLAARWVEQHLPAYAHGSRDQVQLFLVYVRRARGRMLLAAMDATLDGAA
jgi:hypothetical protein